MDILTAKNNQQLIKDNPQNHDSNSKGETTTISTIAVRAEPHSTLVVALLKVDDLLARAEQIASEQTEVSDVIVYEAMANGLATAWRGLSRQLEMRGYILSDTKRLYELALKQEELSKLLGSRLQSTNSNASIDSHEAIIDGKSA
uniref:Four helix bundle protein n=1 Tax=Meloidogyne hapla TaxID=6305 RepID=A0A1I8BK52_MELHA